MCSSAERRPIMWPITASLSRLAAASVTTLRPLRNTVTRSEISSTSSRKCEMKTTLRPSSRSRRSTREEPRHLGRRQRRGRLVEDQDARAGEQHPATARPAAAARPAARPSACAGRSRARGSRSAASPRAFIRAQSTVPSGGQRMRAEEDVLGHASGRRRSRAPGGPCRRPASSASRGECSRTSRPSIRITPS